MLNPVPIAAEPLYQERFPQLPEVVRKCLPPVICSVTLSSRRNRAVARANQIAGHPAPTATRSP